MKARDLLRLMKALGYATDDRVGQRKADDPLRSKREFADALGISAPTLRNYLGGGPIPRTVALAAAALKAGLEPL